jgi:tRNA (adenine57-N1/adenine58-N1)-methyltransferase
MLELKSPGNVTPSAFSEGESILFVDRKKRQYLKSLKVGRPISIRGGKIDANQVIGRENGSFVHTSMGETLLALRPTLAHLIPKLPRRAQLLYPKDIGLILVWADIFPGATVLEAGVGPGALTLALLRAVGSEGRVISYELRQDFLLMARKNVAQFSPTVSNWTLKQSDVYEQMEERGLDRIILDLSEPWRALKNAWEALVPGGVLCSFLPTVLQVKQFYDAMLADGGFGVIEILEGFLRFWEVREMSIRPQHRMVAHTGFITIARKTARR